MKFFLYAIIALYLLSAPLFSFPSAGCLPEKNSGEGLLCVGIEGGFIYGLVSEFAYSESKILSRLDWEIKPVYIAGFTIEKQFNAFFAAGGYWKGINTDIGRIEDSDWENLDSVKTHYSKHDNKLISADFFDTKIGYVFLSEDSSNLSANIGASSAIIKMEAVDGYLLYPPDYNPVASEGTGILYEQKYYIFSAGLKWVYFFSNGIGFSAASSISPAVFCKARDNHVKRGLVFYDSIDWAPFFSISLSISYRFWLRYDFFISAGYNIVFESSGDNYQVDTGTGVKSSVYKDSAGIRFEDGIFRAGLRIIVF